MEKKNQNGALGDAPFNELPKGKFNKAYLLPALPKAWREGYVKGLVVREGFEVDIF